MPNIEDLGKMLLQFVSERYLFTEYIFNDQVCRVRNITERIFYEQGHPF